MPSSTVWTIRDGLHLAGLTCRMVRRNAAGSVTVEVLADHKPYSKGDRLNLNFYELIRCHDTLRGSYK